MPPVTEIPPPDIEAVKDSVKTHWVNRAPVGIRPYLQLSRLDRPVGYWLLALPGWIGLAFAGLSHGLAWTDLIWAVLILIGAIAMRGAGCTYNDIVDQDLDAQVERTALRPLPAGTITTKQAWIWTFIQIGIGFCVWLALPLHAKGIALLALPLVAAYPFMKRITWFPQVWLGLTFNWAVLVAYAVKTGEISLPVLILYFGLMFWTVGYDTIYACQDMEDDAMVGIKSTALRFGGRVKLAVGVCYALFLLLAWFALSNEGGFISSTCGDFVTGQWKLEKTPRFDYIFAPFMMSLATLWMIYIWTFFDPNNPDASLIAFKQNSLIPILLIALITTYSHFSINEDSEDYYCRNGVLPNAYMPICSKVSPNMFCDGKLTQP